MSISPSSQTEQFTGEGGNRFDRAWVIREDVEGQVPADRTWMPYSDHLVNFEATIAAGNERVDGLSTPDAITFSSSVEEHEVVIAYSLQRAIVDSNDEPLDPCGDAFLRDGAKQIPNTHAGVFRDDNPSPGPNDPEGCAGQRQYLVMKGGKANVTMEPDATEAAPTPVEMTYLPQKARSYHFFQPEGSVTLCARSTDSNDTTQTVTVEDEGGATSLTLDLNGTTLVTSSTTIDDIDAVELSEETLGDVEIFINTGTDTDPVEGGKITTLRGASYYADDDGAVEGDLGVPALEGASPPSSIGAPFSDFAGDRVERPTGARLAPDINNLTVEVDNGIEQNARQDSTRVRNPEGNREITIGAEVIGESASHHYIEQALARKGLDMEWELTRTLFTFPNTTHTGDLARARESDDTFATTELEFQPEGIQITQVTA